MEIPQFDQTEQSDSIRILSLNGGGVRGLYTISVLAKLEQIIEEEEGKTGVKIGEYFDLITGTSIGGILALGLASGESARDLQEKFKESAPKIFPTLRFKYQALIKLFYPVYRSEPLYETVKSMIGDEITFKELNRRVMIPSLNLSTGEPKFFKTLHGKLFNLDGNIRLIDAAMATSAAPTYFKPHFIESNGQYYADGGLVANNPSYVGIREVLIDMQEDFPNTKPEDVKILNIGTLSEKYCIGPNTLKQKCSKGYFGLWGLGKRLVSSTMTANQNLQRHMLKRELRIRGIEANYVEIDKTIPNEASKDIVLDNAAESSLLTISGWGETMAGERYTQDEALRNFFKTKAKPFVKVLNNKEAAA